MKRTGILGLAAVVFLAGCSKPANTGAGKPGGGPLGASYEGFRSAFASKDFSRALTELRSLVEAFWAEAPLG